MKKLKSAIFLALTLGFNPTLFSEPSNNPNYVTPYVGIFDVFDSKNYAMLGMEFRGKRYWQYFSPKVGVYANTKHSVYGYLGFNIDIPIYKDMVYIMPGFAAGAYSKGKGKKLGGTLEFRSSIELAYKMPNKHRIGLALSHISNANIYKKNPGAEDLVLTYSLPFE